MAGGIQSDIRLRWERYGRSLHKTMVPDSRSMVKGAGVWNSIPQRCKLVSHAQFNQITLVTFEYKNKH